MTGFGIEEVYVQITHLVNFFISLTEFLLGFIKICLKSLWRVMLPVDYSTDNITFLFKKKLYPKSLKGLEVFFYYRTYLAISQAIFTQIHTEFGKI